MNAHYTHHEIETLRTAIGKLPTAGHRAARVRLRARVGRTAVLCFEVTKTFRRLIVVLSRFPSVANRTAIPSLVAGAALALVQPCAGLSFEFQETGSQAMAHPNAPATLLANGQVLIAGGDGPIATAEIYDQRNGTWTATGSLDAARSQHTATLLPNGKVLVAGGMGGELHQYRERGTLRSGNRNLVRNWRPRQRAVFPHGDTLGRWQGACCRRNRRHRGRPERGTLRSCDGHLDENRTVKPHASSPYRDPAARRQGARGRRSHRRWRSHLKRGNLRPGEWDLVNDLPSPEERGLHSATLLQNGMVLVAGGFSNSGPLSRADLYDPASGTWSPTGALPVAVFLHAATLLPNGAVLATGGTVGADAFSTAAEIYDPRNGTWTATGSLNVGRRDHTSILLRKGKVLVVAGQMFPDSGSTELGSRVQQ